MKTSALVILALGLAAQGCTATGPQEPETAPPDTTVSASAGSTPPAADSGGRYISHHSPAQREAVNADPGAIARVSMRSPAPPAARLDVEIPHLRLRGETDLRQVMKYLAEVSGTTIVVHQEAEEAFQDESVELNLERERPISLRNALNLITELAGEQVVWVARWGVVLVTTPERARARPVTQIFEVRDLLHGVPDYVAREIDLRPRDLREELGAGSFAERVPALEEDALVDLIRNTISPEIWDDPRNSITVHDGKLIVTVWGP